MQQLNNLILASLTFVITSYIITKFIDIFLSNRKIIIKDVIQKIVLLTSIYTLCRSLMIYSNLNHIDEIMIQIDLFYSSSCYLFIYFTDTNSNIKYVSVFLWTLLC